MSCSVRVGGLTFLTIVFAFLKLLGILHWSWWWVTFPIWGYILFLIILFIIGFILGGIQAISEHNSKWR
jgi:NAD/NADP transhydrogenase beta subunit